MKGLAALLFSVILAAGVASCSKKGSPAPDAPVREAATAAATAVATPPSYPDTAVYTGSFYASQQGESTSTIDPYTFFVIHINAATLVFMNATTGFVSVNDTAAVNETNMYTFTVPAGKKILNGPEIFTISGSGLSYSFWYESEVCSEPPPVYYTFNGALQPH
jgi:hypothetical protein